MLEMFLSFFVCHCVKKRLLVVMLCLHLYLCDSMQMSTNVDVPFLVL